MSSASSSFRFDWPGTRGEVALLGVLALAAVFALTLSGLPARLSVALWFLACSVSLWQWRRRRRPRALRLVPADALHWEYADGTSEYAVLRHWRRLGPLLQLHYAAERGEYRLLWLPGLDAEVRRGLMRALARMSSAA